MLLAEAVLRYANGGLDLIYVRRQLVLPITRSPSGQLETCAVRTHDSLTSGQQELTIKTVQDTDI
jgi:hypothetical protein